MERINERQRTFARKVVQELKPASVAYSETYGVTGRSAENAGSRLLGNVGVQDEMEKLREKIKSKADYAFEQLLKMADDPMTPAGERRKIFEAIMSRSNLDAAQRVEQKDTTEFPSLTDLTRGDLLKMLQDDAVGEELNRHGKDGYVPDYSGMTPEQEKEMRWINGMRSDKRLTS